MTIKYQILQGDNRETLKTLPDNSIDAIVTDPPYGIDFLGKDWDANTGALETYTECLRVLKPGGHILAFSAARTYHHLAVTLEQAGFEIRDQIMWIYSSGFPKSQDVGRQIHKKENGQADKQKFDPAVMIKIAGDQYRHPDSDKVYRKLPDINGDNLARSHEGSGYGAVYQEVIAVDSEWSGWGSALKPAHEPIALARKPLTGSIRENCLTWGVGAINIDATRIPYANEADLNTYLNNIAGPMERSTISEGTNIGMHEGKTGFKAQKGKVKRPGGGGNNAATFKNFSAEERTTKDRPTAGKRTASFHTATGGGETQSGGDGSGEWTHNEAGRFPSNVIGEIAEPYQKYFYCPKVGRAERHVGFDVLDTKNNAKDKIKTGLVDKNGNTQTFTSDPATHNTGNNHPTVKPIELMKYLIKLITPAGGTVLDPFNGSGSTGCAAVELGMEYIGCELDPAYVDIARTRIEAWYALTHPLQATGLFE